MTMTEEVMRCYFCDIDLDYPKANLFGKIADAVQKVFAIGPKNHITRIVVSRNVFNSLAKCHYLYDDYYHRTIIDRTIIDKSRNTIKMSSGVDYPVEVYDNNPYSYEFAIIHYVDRSKSPCFECKLPDRIEKVIYRDPATIILWSDGTKTVVKCQEGDTYDFEKGFLLCFVKKVLGNSSKDLNYILKESQKLIECEIPDKKKGKKNGKKSKRKPKEPVEKTCETCKSDPNDKYDCIVYCDECYDYSEWEAKE